VARIAHLASDVIVSVVPSLATESEFSETLRALQKDNATSVVAKSQPEVCHSLRWIEDAKPNICL
jgi:sulfite reductase (NADPH) hemoprotein beta-component